VPLHCRVEITEDTLFREVQWSGTKNRKTKTRIKLNKLQILHSPFKGEWKRKQNQFILLPHTQRKMIDTKLANTHNWRAGQLQNALQEASTTQYWQMEFTTEISAKSERSVLDFSPTRSQTLTMYFSGKILSRFSVFHLYNFFQFCANASKQTFAFAGINRVASNQTFVCTIKLNSSWKTLMCLRGYFASVLFRLLPLFESLKSTRGLLVAKLLARVYCTGGSKSSLFLSVHS